MKKTFEYQIDLKKSDNSWIAQWRGTFLFATSSAFLGKINHLETSYLVRYLASLK